MRQIKPSKQSRKLKWKGVALNHSNIDEYMQDLINSTSSQYITQGVSFNKDDHFHITLLKNSILAHGSFSGFVKELIFDYFEKNGSIDDSVWQPNIVEDEGFYEPSPSPTTPNTPKPPNQPHRPVFETSHEDEPNEGNFTDNEEENLETEQNQDPVETAETQKPSGKPKEKQQSKLRVQSTPKRQQPKRVIPNAEAFLPKH